MLARLYARIVVACRPNIEASLVALAELYKSELASRIIANLVQVKNPHIVYIQYEACNILLCGGGRLGHPGGSPGRDSRPF